MIRGCLAIPPETNHADDMKFLSFSFFLMILCPNRNAMAQSTLPLWPDEPPDSVAEENQKDQQVKRPELKIFAPKNSNGAAVLVLPGGGYGQVCYHTEGEPIARRLNQRGITAAVLTYRLPRGKAELPGTDARRAMRLLRHLAADFQFDPKRVGVWGFSAGGHLAATLSCTGTKGDPKAKDLVERESARPDFSILFYPVISMQPGVTHAGSRRNLLGDNPSAEQLDKYSMEKQVDQNHPPTFLLLAGDDRAVPAENSIRYYQALVKAGSPVALHSFPKGGHGPNAFKRNPSWEAAFDDWLRDNKLMKNDKDNASR